MAIKPTVNILHDYYAFGSPMPGRNASSGDYRYGFNGYEKDNEIKGNGNSLDFGARIYDPRLGRWLSVDPLTPKYPYLSPYLFSNNNPILFQDFDGQDFIVRTKAGKEKTMTAIKLAFGTDEGFSFKRGKLRFDKQKFNKAAGNLSDAQQYLMDNFVKGIVENKDVKLKLKLEEGLGGAGTEWDFGKSFEDKDRKPGKDKGVIFIDPSFNLSLLTFDTDSKAQVDFILGGGDMTLANDEDVFQADVLWHEIGHFVSWMKGANFKPGGTNIDNNQQAVGFENVFRTILGLPLRQGEIHGDDTNDKTYKGAGAQNPDVVSEPVEPFLKY